MITAGIDIGSITAKAVLMADGRMIRSKIGFTGYNSEKAGTEIFESLLEEAGIRRESVERIITTGYGRNSIKFADKAATEIICHGIGAHFQDPSVRTIIDIGGQDSKVITLDENGRVKEFSMNDKCAAGTGRFLEVMARALEVDLEAFGRLSLSSQSPLQISSTCTVFAESEVISLIAKGARREDIIAGIHESIAARISSMVRQVGLVPPVLMTGGVAKNSGLVHAIEKKLGTKIGVLDTAQVNGAIGAAVLAWRTDA